MPTTVWKIKLLWKALLFWAKQVFLKIPISICFCLFCVNKEIHLLDIWCGIRTSSNAGKLWVWWPKNQEYNVSVKQVRLKWWKQLQLIGIYLVQLMALYQSNNSIICKCLAILIASWCFYAIIYTIQQLIAINCNWFNCRGEASDISS